MSWCYARGVVLLRIATSVVRSFDLHAYNSLLPYLSQSAGRILNVFFGANYLEHAKIRDDNVVPLFEDLHYLNVLIRVHYTFL